MSQSATDIPAKSVLEIEEMLTWLDKIQLSRPNRKLSRDFSDALLMAEVIKETFPRVTVDLHNYPSRSAVCHKMENWLTLNQKILRRLGLAQPRSVLEDLANGVPGIVEQLLCRVKDKSLETRDREERMRAEACTPRMCACAVDDVINGDVFMAPRHKHTGQELEVVQEKVIIYSEYVKLEKELYEKNEALAILRQKVTHLDNLIQIKDGRINELLKHLKRHNSSSVFKGEGDSINKPVQMHQDVDTINNTTTSTSNTGNTANSSGISHQHETLDID